MINKFKGLLGFEKTFDPPLSQRCINQLSNIFRFSLWDTTMIDVGSEVISEAEYIVYCVQLGLKLTESIDAKCYKCHTNNCAGEAICPNGKKIYRIGNESFGTIISKLGYDFANYLISNGLTNCDAVQDVISRNRSLYEKKPKVTVLQQPDNDIPDNAIHKNDDEYNKWLHNKITEYGGSNLFEAAKYKTLREVYLDILWQYDDYFDKKLLVLIDNIENERCRRDLTAHLLKNNKASVTAFETITGINLPRVNNDRKTLLSKTTAAQYTLHPAEYTPRNPIERSEYCDRFYMWCVREDKKYGFVECRGKLWRHGNSDFFIQKESGSTFKASEGRTGLKARDKSASIDSLKEAVISKINKLGDKYEEHIKNALKISGLSPLYNSSK